MDRAEVIELARRLAKEHVEGAPELEVIYVFPDEEELRMVEVDPLIPRALGDRVEPFYFRADPANGLPLLTALAVIRPEEDRVLRLPDEWGAWDDAVQLWPEAA